MERYISQTLQEWLVHENRKPLLLMGARQVGKTYSLREFGRTCFPRYHFINFEEQPSAASIFRGDLTPGKIIQDISLYLDTPIDPDQDLLVLDEIQACPEALTSLKYFQAFHF